jgi:hypothetical protein
MNARYYRNFSVGTSTHVVQLYAFYTDDQGLASLVDEVESTRMADIIKDIKGELTEIQIDTLRKCMKDKTDVIVLPDGRIGR